MNKRSLQIVTGVLAIIPVVKPDFLGDRFVAIPDLWTARELRRLKIGGQARSIQTISTRINASNSATSSWRDFMFLQLSSKFCLISSRNF